MEHNISTTGPRTLFSKKEGLPSQSAELVHLCMVTF